MSIFVQNDRLVVDYNASSVGPSVAYDHGSAVSTRHAAPFPFEGTLHEVEIQLFSRQDAEARDAEAAAEMSRQ